VELFGSGRDGGVFGFSLSFLAAISLSVLEGERGDYTPPCAADVAGALKILFVLSTVCAWHLFF
jgi:hypothetical protein